MALPNRHRDIEPNSVCAVTDTKSEDKREFESENGSNCKHFDSLSIVFSKDVSSEKVWREEFINSE